MSDSVDRSTFWKVSGEALDPGGPKTFEGVARRVLAEFEEMPGLSLTVPQAARLFGLDEATCRIVLDALVDSAYLKARSSGVVVRGVRVAA